MIMMKENKVMKYLCPICGRKTLYKKIIKNNYHCSACDQDLFIKIKEEVKRNEKHKKN